MTAVGGLVIFLGFLFLAVQVTVHLFTISTAGAIALEAANRAAQSGGAANCDGTRGVASLVMHDMGRDTPVTLAFLDPNCVAVDNPASLLVRCHRAS